MWGNGGGFRVLLGREGVEFIGTMYEVGINTKNLTKKQKSNLLPIKMVFLRFVWQ